MHDPFSFWTPKAIEIIIANYSHIFAAPPPQPPSNSIQVESSSGNSVNDSSVRLMITFDTSFSEENRIERYCLRSLNTACPKDSCIPAGGGYYTCDGLEAGVEYNFTVRAVNCGNQESNETEVIIIAPQSKLSLLLTISSRLALFQCCQTLFLSEDCL